MIFEIIAKISNWALEIIDQFGYWGIFVLSLLESAAIPIPSEVVVPFSGFLAARGTFDFWLIVFTVSFANLVGAVILYYISISGGRLLILKFGKYFFVSELELEKADKLFKKHGTKFIFIGRLLPVVRTFISIPAGVARMNILKFITYTFLGSLPWNFVLALVGFKAGENWDLLSPYFRKFDFVIIAVIAIVVVWYIRNHIKK